METKLKVTVDGSAGAAGAKEVESALRSMNEEGKKSGNIFDTITDSLTKMGSAGSSLGGFLRDVFSIEALLTVSKTVFDVSNRLQGFVSTMSVVTGSMAAARDEMTYLFSVANKWGADIDSVTNSYAKLAAAAKGTALEGAGVRQIFESITQASVALHLSTEDTRLVFFALQQMVSKGKVSMEELRKQLAERFPGAIQIAADSLGVTVDAMEKMIKKGELLAVDFLPKFAEAIQDAFGDAAVLASRSLLAEINRLKNAWEAFLLKLAESGVIESASEAVRVLTNMLSGNSEIALSLGLIMTDLIKHVTNFLSSLRPEDISSFFTTAIQLAGIAVDIFGRLAKAVVWLADTFGPLVSLVGGAMVDAFTALYNVVTGILPFMKRFVDFANGDLTLKQWVFGMEKATDSTRKFGISNDDARDKMVQLAREADRKNEIDAKALKNAQAALADSQRSVDIKTQEISVFQRLNEITAERNKLEKIANDGSVTDQDRVRAITQLITLNKEYGTVKANADKEAAKMSKEATKDLKDQWKATETLVASLEKQQYALQHTRIEEELRAAAIAVSTIRNKADRAAMLDRLSTLITTNDELRRAQEEEKELNKLYEEHIKTYDKQIEATDELIKKVKEETEEIGKTKAEIDLLKASRLEAQIVALEVLLTQKELTNACSEEAERIKTLITSLKELKKAREEQAGVQSNNDITVATEKSNKKLVDDFQKTADSISQSLTDALLRGFEDGASFAENFKNTLMNMFKTMILKPIIQPIVQGMVGDLSSLLGLSANPTGPGLGSILSGGGGGGSGNLFSQLFGGSSTANGGLGGGSNNIFGTWMSNLFGGNSDMGPGDAVGQITGLGNQIADAFSTALSGATIGTAIGNMAAQFFGNERNKQGMEIGGTIGGIAGSFVGGPLGAVIGSAIGSAIGSLFKSGGGPKGGGFFASGDTAGISGTDSTGRWFTPNDQDKAVKTIVEATSQSYTDLLRTLGGKGSASFALGFDTDPKGTAPNRVHAGAFMNGTQIYDAALGDLGRDPETLKAALETEAKRSLLAALQASDLPAYLSTIFDSVDVATADSSTIDNLLQTAQGLKAVVDIMPQMADVFNSLDPEQVQGFIDAMGGIESLTQTMAYLSDNFVSSATKQAKAQELLNTTFGDLGLEVPKTHQAFLDLLESIPLTDEAGQQLYATISGVAEAFVAVNGTADQAAEALSRQAEANAELAQAAQEFFDANFMSESENRATALQADWAAVHQTWNEIGETMLELGFDHIPTTNAAFKKLVLGIDRSTDSGEALYQRLLLLAPAILDLNAAMTQTSQAVSDATDFFNQNFYSSDEQAAQTIQNSWSAIQGVWTEFGAQLMELGYSAIPTTNAGFRAMIESLREMGLNDLADSLILLAPTIFDLNGAIDQLANSASNAGSTVTEAVNNINRALEQAQEQASEAQKAYSAIISSINELVNSSGGSFGDKASLRMKLLSEQMKRINELIEEEMGGPNMYGPLIQQYKETLAQLAKDNAKAAAQLARFTILAAQYDEAKAEQLVGLEEWFTAQSEILAGSPEALAALKELFDQKWEDIINGVAGGVEGAISELERLRQSIREFLQGLLIGDLSPLTPREKLDQAKAQYEKDLALAQAGDLDAMGRLTEDANNYLSLARQFYASSQMYTDIFNSVVDSLKEISKYVEPVDQQTLLNEALMHAIPIKSPIASEENIDKLGATVTATISGVMTEVADRDEENAARIVDALVVKLNELIQEVKFAPK